MYKILSAILVAIVVMSTSIYAQENAVTVLNDTTELHDLGNGKSMKVKYKLGNGKTISIKDKNTLLEQNPFLKQEFNINKEDYSGVVTLHGEISSDKKKSIELEKDTLTTYKLDILGNILANPFPEFEWIDINNRRYSLLELRGKIVVINFWHTSCVPCIAEMPLLNELTLKYKKDKVVFLASTPNKRNELMSFLKKKTFLYSQVHSIEPELFFEPMPGWPVHVVINKEGNISFLVLGKQKDIEIKLAKAIDESLVKE